MSAARLACLVVALIALILPAAAQPVAAPEACTYDACALRVEPGLFGRRIVAGTDGTPVGRLGLFGADLSDAVAPSEPALEHARTYEGSRLPVVLAAVGAGILYSTYFIEAGLDGDLRDDTPNGLETAAVVGALGLTVVGVTFQLRSERALARAVWEYNRDLPR